MFLKIMISTSTISYYNKSAVSSEYRERIERARLAIQKADCIIIGAGAGLSTAAGLEYSGNRFTDNFKPFIVKYGMKDLYTSSFYPFKTQEERWAYWAKHISLNRYETPATELYIELHQFLEEKNYFVITTNVDGQFEKAGFERDKLFEVQGNYAFFQCEMGCHNKLYYNKEIIKRMLDETIDCQIPPHLVPKCPVCGGEMDVNLRKNQSFVEDNNWTESFSRYNKLISKMQNKSVVFLEIGVGYTTPGIIKYPFEDMVYKNPRSILIRINKDFPTGVKENYNSTVSFDENLSEIINKIKTVTHK